MSERDGIQIEMKKNSLKQLQSGDWIVSFTASQIDFPTELATAAMGQRFMAVLVPLGDFEDVPTSQPTSQKPENKHKLSQQAAILCDDRPFQVILMKDLQAFVARLMLLRRLDCVAMLIPERNLTPIQRPQHDGAISRLNMKRG
jgi:hypothetical protein